MTYLRLTLLTALLTAVVFLSGCGSEDQKQEAESVAPREGVWRGVLKTSPEEIPFLFSISKNGDDAYKVELMNGEERIETEARLTSGDSLVIPMHIFDTSLE
ncbi:MAG: hypothetical protein WBH03_11775, partial [Cyclobacteriaceae bacterium]